jgi:hypothetical protein
MSYRGPIPGSGMPPPSVRFDNGHWKFPEQMGSDAHLVGFIYVIRDRVLERFYLGKKLFKGMGRINRGQESNWRKYTSSSKVLNELLKVRPKDEFDFICLEQYRTKGTLSYSETWSLCFVEAPTSNCWYNSLIEKVSWSVRERITDRHKQRLMRVTKWENFDE